MPKKTITINTNPSNPILIRRTTKPKSLKSKIWWLKDFTLKYPVRNGSKVVLPVGTKHVDIAFGASSFQRYDFDAGEWKRMNMYRTQDGKIYHA